MGETSPTTATTEAQATRVCPFTRWLRNMVLLAVMFGSSQDMDGTSPNRVMWDFFAGNCGTLNGISVEAVDGFHPFPVPLKTSCSSKVSPLVQRSIPCMTSMEPWFEQGVLVWMVWWMVWRI